MYEENAAFLFLLGTVDAFMRCTGANGQNAEEILLGPSPQPLKIPVDAVRQRIPS